MRSITHRAAAAVALAALLACGPSVADAPAGDDAGADSPDASGTPSATDPSTSPSNDTVAPPNTTGVGAGSGAATGLPCDVQQLLENRCIGCHASTSPPPLLTYADLVAPSKADPAKTMAQASSLRMKDTKSPMPPAPAVAPDAAEIATFDAWIAAGTPKGAACTTGPDGGAPGGGPATGPYNTPVVCTSNTKWTGGNSGSASMRPGGACQTCHQQRGGPRFDIAGTVYATAHEPNDCNGKGPPPPLTIIVTDKNNKVTTLKVNGVGNFQSKTRIVPPFKVAVSDGTKTRAMAGSLTAGDCNSCHTEAGANGAPGRIMAP